MRYAELAKRYYAVAGINHFPVRMPDKQDAFNQLQTELEGITGLLNEVLISLNTHELIKPTYSLRCFSLKLTKLEPDYWMVESTDLMPNLPECFTVKQNERVLNQLKELLNLGTAILTNKYLIDYVGVDSQLDWDSIANVLTAGVNLIDIIGSKYGNVTVRS